MIPNVSLTRVISTGASVLVFGLVVVTADQSRGGDPIGSLSELTTEVRLLRNAVEKATQTQSQVQAMSVYLSAQQNRLNQSVARADALRIQLDAATHQAQEHAQIVAAVERDLPTILAERPQARTGIEAKLGTLKAEFAQKAQLQFDLRARLAEADASIQGDLVGWREMVARLEQLTRP